MARQDGAYLTIKDWDRFQHYRNRSPPWIKLYSDLLSDYAFACLPEPTQLHLVKMWVLASRNEGRLPDDAAWITRQIGAQSPVDLEILVEGGWLIPHASGARRKQPASASAEHSASAGARETPADVARQQSTSGERRNRHRSTAVASRYQNASKSLAFARSREAEVETESEAETETEEDSFTDIKITAASDPSAARARERLLLGRRNSERGPPAPEKPPAPEDRIEADTTALIVTANLAQRANPRLTIALDPIPTGHASREVAAAWLREGVPRALCEEVIRHTAGEYRPSARSPQIRSVAYFDPAVREEWARKLAARNPWVDSDIDRAEMEYHRREDQRLRKAAAS